MDRRHPPFPAGVTERRIKMHYGILGTEYRDDLRRERFLRAFAFLRRGDLADLPEGWIELGDGVRASVQQYTTSPAEALSFETHERYYDIQYVVKGLEKVGFCSREGLAEKAPYDAENDITFYEEPPLSGAALLREGDFVLLAPEDAHKPRCAADEPMAVKKIVVKVPV